MTTRLSTLRAALTLAALATGTAGIAGAATAVCDPMYPCVADGTPAAVFDLSARIQDGTAPTAEGLEADVSRNALAARGRSSPPAVYDPAVRTDHAPCQSYPCYPENAPFATPVAADASATLHPVDRRG